MKILVSLLNFRPGKIGGTETYLRQLIELLPAAAERDEVLFLADRDVASTGMIPAENLALINYSCREVIAQRSLEAITPFRAKTVERFIASLQPDVVFFPQQSIFPKCVEAPATLVVHDLYHIVFPQYLSLSQRIFRNAVYDRSLGRANQIITVSNTTRDSLIERCNVSPDKIVTIPHGYVQPAAFDTTTASPVQGRFVYYPASSYPHKNHTTLFEAVARLRKDGNFPYRLVLSGMQTRHWNKLRNQITRLGLDDVVTHLGFIPYDVVLSLYRDAECIVFPSMYEGFGIPVLEALSHRKKIICSKAPIFEELGVQRIFQIDFSNSAELDRALKVQGLVDYTAKHQSWQQTAQMTAQVLRSAAEKPVLLKFDANAATSNSKQSQVTGRLTTTTTNRQSRRAA